MSNKLQKLLERNKKVDDLKIEIEKRIDKVGDFEFMVGDIQDMITKTNVKLINKELIEISNMFYNKGDQSIERLELADKLYAEIDHANSMIIENNDSTVGLIYKYQCNEWQKLILKSIEDLDDREIRIQILQHPFNCQHPTCIQVANHMKGILK